MPTPTARKRAHQVLDFLLGLRHPEVLLALTPHGFTDADRAEGHALLAALTAVSAYDPSYKKPDTIGRLDAWENRWLPIARATLRHRYPEVYTEVFGRTTQTSGIELVITVDFILRKLDALGEATDATSREALALLTARGLTTEVLGEARALLAEATNVTKRAYEPIDEDAVSATEEALARYYAEWSAIARVAVTDRRHLAWLGLTRVGRKPKNASDDERRA